MCKSPKNVELYDMGMKSEYSFQRTKKIVLSLRVSIKIMSTAKASQAELV
jgi:hypothetical protein